jgi:diguanylate cyclase (GGDEF)-like protein
VILTPAEVIEPSATPALSTRASENFRYAIDELARQVDRMFVWLLAAEWLGMMAAALVVTPRVWSGAQNALHPHLWAALLAGPVFIIPAIMVALLWPGSHLSRHVIAVAQILVSVLLIDVTGGRIETHFHIFGSLAFLAFYRDWRVLVTASALTAVDHFVRGVWWPQSVYGITTASSWRWVEHAWWVVFEDFFLIIATRRSIREMWAVAVSKAQLYTGAYHDILTGLANRRLLQERFESQPQAERDSSRAIIFIDLDRFKQANDTLGHTVGDKLLTLVAQRLSSVTPDNGTLARVGGDEFVFLLDTPAGLEEAVEGGASLLHAMAAPFSVDGHELLLSASVGISLYPEHGQDLETLQERADQAMYSAKSQGRNRCVVFSTELAKHENMLKEVGRDLYKALINNELQVHFQPLVERGAKLIGFEALLRWTHPRYGSIAPSDFIPLAERSGAIVAIGEWVLREACRSCRLWQTNAQSPLGVAVNVSAVQFEEPDFPMRVKSIVSESGLDPALLTLELTEGVLVRDLERARTQLAGLRDMGIRVALDDFGTGYSSLSYLTSMPADSIKLDRSFLSREFAKSAAVIESIIEMAHRLGLRVVGEGIETRAESERLFDLSCDELQGFYFSRAIPADAVQEFVKWNRLAIENDGRRPEGAMPSGEAAREEYFANLVRQG